MTATDDFQAHWPAPKLDNLIDEMYGHFPAIEYERGDGERVIVQMYEDGTGRLVIGINGTEGADIVVEEDDASTAAVNLTAFHCPTDYEVDPDASDWARINEVSQENHWRHYRSGQRETTTIYERPGQRLIITYSPSGRVIHAVLVPTVDANPVGAWTHFVGRDRATQVLAAVTAEQKEQAAS